MQLFAHAGSSSGYGDNPLLTPWEIHPVLIHFPIAFLLGAVIVSAYASARGRLGLQKVATGLFMAGVGTGLLAGAAGLLAFFTLPESHTEAAHRLMYWHLGFMVGSLLLFVAVAWIRWRNAEAPPGAGTQLLMWLAAVIFVVGAAFGGYIVYHGGTGIEEDLLKPGLHEEHHHHEGEEYPVQPEDHSGHESSHQDH